MLQQIDNPIVGIDLLKMLMLQLYSNPRCIYREYIQNSLDSINEAVHLGILKRVKDGQVNIHISSDTITIEDNGTGIQSNRAVKILTDIANSIKNGIDTAGQFGVGRLSGGGYCDILEFETSYQGEDVGSVVSMDTRILRKLLSERRNDISAEDAMRQICTMHKIKVDAEKHYFIVRLINVVNSAEILLNTEDIQNYIRDVAPIDYGVTFNSLINTSEQNEFIERHKGIDKIRVSLNEIANIEKTYDITVQGSGDIIEKIRYFELPTHEKYGRMGWGWYAVTEFSVQISEEKDSNAGIRLRKHNISLDKNFLNTYFKEARGNKYFYGEIFITNDNIVPDSGRQGLAAGEEADALIKTIKDYFGVLHLVYNKANRLKTKLKNIQEALNKINENQNAAVRNILLRRLKEVVQDFDKFASNDSRDEINDVIAIYRNKYAQNLQQEVNRLLDAKEEDVCENGTGNFVNEHIVEKSTTTNENLLSNESTLKTDSPFLDNGQKVVSTTSSILQVQSSTIGETVSSEPDSSQSTPTSVYKTNQTGKRYGEVDELIKPLIDKGYYTSEQLEVLKRVLKTMLMACPKAKKKNLSLLMQLAIASLE